MALLNIFRGTQAEVSARPVSDGALLFATDTKKIYLDKGSDRIEMSSVEDLSDYVTSSELEGLLVTKADAAHTHADATGDASGFMSSADKTKLDSLVGLPEGGTDGQVLTKTADGEAWEDVPAPDMTGVVKTDSSGKVISGGSNTNISVYNGDNYVSLSALPSNMGAKVNAASQYGTIGLFSSNKGFGLWAMDDGEANLGGIGTYYELSDEISSSTSTIATGKAVIDYVAANAGSSIDLPLHISQGGTGVTTEDALVQLVFNSASTPQASDTQYGVVKFASDEDFKAYMGIS